MHGYRIISGHLTTRDRQGVAFMLKNGVTQAHSNRIRWRMDGEGSERIIYCERDARDDWNRPIVERNRAVIRLAGILKQGAI